MSLINDALKKAQRQRTGGAEPSPDAAGSPTPADGTRRPTSSTPWLLLVGGAVLGVVLAVGAFILWPRSAATPAQTAAVTPAPATTATAPATQPANPPVATVTPAQPAEVTTATAPAVQPAVALPIAATPAPVETTPAPTTPATVTLQVPVPAPAVAATEPAKKPATPAPAAPAEPAGPSAAFVNTVLSLRVAGIRFAGADSKVIMNDRVFRIGDMVEVNAGIRLTGVTPDSLTFVDLSGATYTRRF